MATLPLHDILEERLAYYGFRCITRKVDHHGAPRFVVSISHQDGRRGKMVSKRRSDALMSLIHIMDMPEMTSF